MTKVGTTKAERDRRKLDALARVLDTAREVARMRAPSVAELLRRRGFKYEAGKVAELVEAIDALDALSAAELLPGAECWRFEHADGVSHDD